MCYLFLNILVPAFAGLNAPYWTYDGHLGPDNWGNFFPNCGGNSQSPIDLVHDDVMLNKTLSPLKFLNYNLFPNKMTLKNNGHSAQVEADISDPATVQGGPLNGIYQFSQFHFHWGSNDSRGSEHTINGQRYPSELHLVHFKSAYGSAAEAAKHKDGLAVLGVMLEIGPNTNVKFDGIFNGLKEVLKAGTNSTIKSYPLSLLLPYNLKEYYTYSGSLTTPTCDEVVTWIVFRNAVKVSSAQVAKFRKLRDDQGDNLLHNYRPLQNLNDRKVSHPHIHY